MVNQFLIAAMNRLAPLITRRTGSWAAALPATAAVEVSPDGMITVPQTPGRGLRLR